MYAFFNVDIYITFFNVEYIYIYSPILHTIL